MNDIVLYFQVAFVAYEGGNIVASMQFNAAGTDKINWFSKGKMTSFTPWTDLSSHGNNYFKYV